MRALILCAHLLLIAALTPTFVHSFTGSLSVAAPAASVTPRLSPEIPAPEEFAPFALFEQPALLRVQIETAVPDLGAVYIQLVDRFDTLHDEALVDEHGQVEFLVRRPGEYYLRPVNALGLTIALAEKSPLLITAEMSRRVVEHTLGIEQPQAAPQLSSDIVLQQTTGAISGRVTAADTGQPLANVEVEAGGRTTVTDSNGNYIISNLRANSYLVGFSPPAQASSLSYRGSPYMQRFYPDSFDAAGGHMVQVSAGQTTGGVDVALERGGRISGILGFSAGRNNTRVTIRIFDAQGIVVSEFRDGQGDPFAFTSDALPNGMYRILFDVTSTQPATHYASEFYNGVGLLSAATDITIDGTASVDIGFVRLDFGGAISGVVTANDGSSTSGVDVQVFDADGRVVATGTVDSSGYYRTSPGLQRGSYRVGFATKPRTSSNPSLFVPEYYNNQPDLASADVVEISSTSTLSGINAALAVRGSIRVRVINPAGEGLKDVSVRVHDCNGNSVGSSTRTDSNGYMTTPPLATGSYRLYFSTDSGPAQYASAYSGGGVNSRDAEIIEVQDGRQTPYTMILRIGGVISGRITAAEDGRSLQQVRVSAYQPGGGGYVSTITAADGTYRLIGVAGGQYYVKAAPVDNGIASGYIGQWYRSRGIIPDPDILLAIAAPEERPNINISLSRGTRLSGQITAEDTGAPLPDVDISIQSAEGYDLAHAVTDANGRYNTNALPPGVYSVLVEVVYFSDSRGYSNVRFEDIVITGESAVVEQDAVLSRGATISGMVTSPDGTPVRSASVDIFNALNGSYAYTQPDGTFALYGVPPGGYRISIGGYPTNAGERCGDTGYTYEYFNNRASFAAADLFAVTSLNPISLGAIVLDGGAAATSHAIAGAVLNDQRQPLAGVRVFIPGGPETTSDSSGNYVLRDLAAGEYSVQAESAGYRFFPRTVRVPPDSSGRDFVAALSNRGLCTAGNGFAPIAPARTDEFFIAASGERNDTPTSTTCTFTVPIDRFFGATLPGTSLGIGEVAPGVGRIELMLRNSAGPTLTSVRLNSTLITDRFSADPRWRSLSVPLSNEQILRLTVPISGGNLDFDPERHWIDTSGGTGPTPATNTITVEGPAGLEVAWAAISIEGALRPIVFLHGWTGGPGTFEQFATLASGTLDTQIDDIPHLPVAGMNYGRGVLSNEYMIRQLGHYIDVSRRIFGVDKVNIIAHSWGGVISRLAMEDQLTALKVENILTLSSPHHGFDVAKVLPAGINRCVFDGDSEIPDYAARCRQVANSMRRDPMRRLNYGSACQRQFLFTGSWQNCVKQFGAQEQTAYGVNYWAFNGSGLFEIASSHTTFPWLNSCANQPEPTVGQVDKQYNLRHDQTNNDNDVYHDAVDKFRDYTDRRRTWEPYACDQDNQGANAQLQQATAAYQTILAYEGNLAPGASHRETIALPGNAAARFVAIAGSELQFSLKQPDGVMITPTTVPTGMRYEQFSDDDGSHFSVYEVDAAAAGNWELIVAAGSAVTPFALLAEVQSAITLEATTNHLVVQPGEQAAIFARLFDGANTISADVQMRATSPDGTLLTLRDDGIAPDTTAQDGIFSATIPAQTTATYYTVDVVAIWPGGRREQTAVFMVEKDLAQIVDLPYNFPYDLDSFGRWNTYYFNVSIRASGAGQVQVSGRVTTSDGAEIGRVSQVTSVVSGTQSFDLIVPGWMIHDAQQSGFYTLSDLVIEGELDGELSLHRSELSTTTAQYHDWRDFNGEPIRADFMPSGQRQANGTLVFTAALDVDYPMEYRWSGDLYTSDDVLLAHSATVQQQVNGHQIILFSFPSAVVPNSSAVELRNVTIEATDGSLQRWFGRPYAVSTYIGEQGGTTLFLPIVRK